MRKTCQTGRHLEVKVENVGDVDVAGREAHVLAKEVGQGEVPVSGVPFRQEHRVVEAEVFASGHFLWDSNS